MFGVGQRLIDCCSDCAAVMSVDVIDNLPGVRFESTCSVISETATDLAIDRNIIVIIQADELAGIQDPGE